MSLGCIKLQSVFHIVIFELGIIIVNNLENIISKNELSFVLLVIFNRCIVYSNKQNVELLLFRNFAVFIGKFLALSSMQYLSRALLRRTMTWNRMLIFRVNACIWFFALTLSISWWTSRENFQWKLTMSRSA